MAKNRVLMLCAAFPPIGGSGVQRSVKFVKYLPQFGWQPYVVSASHSEVCVDGLDKTLLKDIPKDTFIRGIKPIRPPSLEIASDVFFSFLARRSSGFLSRIIKRLRAGLKWRLKLLDFIIRSTPDQFFYWSILSIPSSLYLIKKYKIRLIYVSAPPYSSFLAGVFLKIFTHKRLVVDFRDPWSFQSGYKDDFRLPFFKRLHRLVVNKADKVINVNHIFTNEMFHIFNARNRKKFVCITNGFDPEDFSKEIYSNPKNSDQNGKIIMSHIGFAYGNIPISLFQGLELLKSENEEIANKIEIRFVTLLSSKDQSYLNKSTIKDLVRVEHRVNHPTAIKYMCNSDILLLLIRNDGYGAKIHCGKLFEYINSGTPILALAPKGIASEVIEETVTGITLSPSDTAGIAKTLREIVTDYDGFRRKYFYPDKKSIEKYSRKELTKKLAETFNELVT